MYGPAALVDGTADDSQLDNFVAEMLIPICRVGVSSTGNGRYLAYALPRVPYHRHRAVQGTLGQIQTINAEKVEVNRLQDRDEWIYEFYEQVQVGIKRKMHLLNEELDHFIAHGNIEYNVII